MLLFHGSGHAYVDLEHEDTGFCENCDEDSVFSMLFDYEYEYVFFVFGNVTSKNYYYRCNACGSLTRLDPVRVEAFLGEAPIPFMRNFGFLLLFATILVCASISVLFAAK
jgi:hypothetical protein